MPRVSLGRCLTLIAAVALHATPAVAQPSTADGVQAMLRGDYQAAVSILRPLAETSAESDPVAQLFMAMLYSAGAPGLPRNIWRACALYLNAGRPPSPFMNQALVIGQAMRERFGAAADQMCDPSSVFRSRPPETFTLGKDHVAVVDDIGISVTYMGMEQRAFSSVMGALVPLPSRYTPLTVLNPREQLRHFIELFVWVPHPNTEPRTWTLGWLLLEIIGLRAPIVASERALATIVAPQPPTDIDVGTLVRLRVNDEGFLRMDGHGRVQPAERNRAREGTLTWAGFCSRRHSCFWQLHAFTDNRARLKASTRSCAATISARPRF